MEIFFVPAKLNSIFQFCFSVSFHFEFSQLFNWFNDGVYPIPWHIETKNLCEPIDWFECIDERIPHSIQIRISEIQRFRQRERTCECRRRTTHHFGNGIYFGGGGECDNVRSMCAMRLSI